MNFLATTFLLVASVSARSLHHNYGKSVASTYDLPLTWNSFGFLSNVSIGTPPQQLPVFVDWTWIGQYLLTPKCEGTTNDTSSCFSAQQPMFQPTQSSTYKDESALYQSRTWNPNHFFFYEDETVDYASDIETVGPSSTSMILQTADFQFDIASTPFPFAGVYGLSPVFAGDNSSVQSPFYQAWAAGTWECPVVAFHYCYNGSADAAKASCGGHDGLQTLGGYNPALVSGAVTWYDVIVFPEVNTVDFVYAPAVYNYWALNLTGLSLGDEPQALNASTGASAIFDHASYGRGAPLSVNAYNSLLSKAAATPITLEAPLNNGNQSWYQVDCGMSETLPPIRYAFKGAAKEWEIPAKHYVDDIGNGTCVLNVRTLGDGDMIAGNFGETFSKDKYIMFDFEKLKVGIADLKW